MGGTEDGVPLMRCELIPLWVGLIFKCRRSGNLGSTKKHLWSVVTRLSRPVMARLLRPAMINAGHGSPLCAPIHTATTYTFHRFGTDYDCYPGGNRHKVWEAKTEKWQEENTSIMIQRMHVLFFGRGNPEMLGRYKIGEVRTVDEWAREAGLELKI